MFSLFLDAYAEDEINYQWKGNKDQSIQIMNDHLAQLALVAIDIDRRIQKFVSGKVFLRLTTQSSISSPLYTLLDIFQYLRLVEKFTSCFFRENKLVSFDVMLSNEFLNHDLKNSFAMFHC